MSEVLTRFRQRWADAVAEQGGAPELLPVRLARACSAVLPVDGASLSLFSDDHRVPLGASDQHAAHAERLQFTVGDGPCLHAARTGCAVVAAGDELHRRWPVYTAELFASTPYRAVVSLPLTLVASTTAALDLFFTDPVAMTVPSLADTTMVCDQIIAAITDAPPASDAAASQGEELAEESIYGPATRDRTYVWIAMGLVITKFDLHNSDALALLRSYAYSHDTLLEATAVAIVQGTLDIAQLRP